MKIVKARKDYKKDDQVKIIKPGHRFQNEIGIVKSYLHSGEVIILVGDITLKMPPQAVRKINEKTQVEGQ